MTPPVSDRPAHIVVGLPSWVGDAVMATPTLRALRLAFAEARITYWAKPYVADVFDASPWHDDVVTDPGGLGRAARRSLADLAGHSPPPDWAILLSNSLRSALLTWWAGIPRRIGYSRDARGWLLTDRLCPLRDAGRFVPVPVLGYYLGLARYVGANHTDRAPRVYVSSRDRQDADELLASLGLAAGESYIAINPGAAFGSAKMWGTERFAALADTLVERGLSVGGGGGYRVVVLCGPRETAIAAAIAGAQRHAGATIHLAGRVGRLGLVKAIIARAAALVTNDSGPRHFAIALDRPVVTLFGPTAPEWTECQHPREVQLIGRVPCGPCALRVCPLDHRCMARIPPAAVLAALDRLLGHR